MKESVMRNTTTRTHRKLNRAGVCVAVFLVAAVLAPFVLAPYHVFQLTMVAGYSVALLGLGILMGYNGQVSLGHGAFYALGAYVAGILMDHFGISYVWTLPAAAAAGLLIGFLFGIPATRLENLYLALATFGLAVAVPQLLKYPAFDDWTGGFQGITLEKPEVPFHLPITQDQWLYYGSLAVAVLMFVLARNLLDGRIGRAMIAVRDHPVAASAMGIDVGLLKAFTFGVSAMFTAIAGALSSITVQYVSPDSFGMFLSITFLVGTVAGGLGTLAGPVCGAFFIVLVPNLSESVSKSAPWAVYGVFLIAVVFVVPGGFAALPRAIRKWKKETR
jgi:branched-chain amino acid transport system permease protein